MNGAGIQYVSVNSIPFIYVVQPESFPKKHFLPMYMGRLGLVVTLELRKSKDT